MPRLEITIDATEFIKAFNLGVEAGFILATETPELDQQLNLNNIQLPDGD